MTREITIIPVLNGWIVRCGCQKVVFTDKTIMLNNLSAYYDNPEGTEKAFISKPVNRTEGTIGGIEVARDDRNRVFQEVPSPNDPPCTTSSEMQHPRP